MDKKHLWVAGIAFLALSHLVFSQARGVQPAPERSEALGSYLSLHAIPALELPLGESGRYFTLGATMGLSARYIFPGLPFLFLHGGLEYGLSPLYMDAFLSKASAGAGLGFRVPLGQRLALNGRGTGGYAYDFVGSEGETTGSWFPVISGGAGIELLLGKSLGIEIGGEYRNHLSLYGGAAGYVSTSYRVPARERLKSMKSLPGRPTPLGGGKILELSNVDFVNIFPVFRKYYDTHPIGTATLRNPYDKEVTEITVNLYLPQYMDVPKRCSAPVRLPAGASEEIELNALFTDRVLDITEATKAAVEISLEYTYQGSRYRDAMTETVRVFDRNAMTWDDDRKAAAFVTAKDPMVLTFSKNVAGMIQGKGGRSLDKNLLLGIGLHQALSLYGMTYIIDPRTPYIEFSKKKDSIDFLQFPRQSLEYKAGDCDDLSILYSALLGSLGVETAFVTVPAHIYLAFALDMNEEEARKSFLSPDELIFHGGRAWVPVEITELKGGFLEAWQLGAKQWKEHAPKGQAGFFPLGEAWTLYEPVGLPPGGRDISLPSEDRVVSGYLQEVVRFIDRELYPRVNQLEKEIARTGSVRTINSLGVLYARYGQVDKAEEQFQKVVQKEEYTPSLVNLGNIYYLKKDMKTAAGFYERAVWKDPDNPKVLLAVARVNHELANYAVAQSTFQRLETVDPQLAKEYSYLSMSGSDTARASSAEAAKEKVVWDAE